MSKAMQALKNFLTASPSVVYPDEVLELLQPVDRENAKLKRRLEILKGHGIEIADAVAGGFEIYNKEHARADRLKVENDKLKKLVLETWRSCPVSEDDCKKCPHYIEESDEVSCDIPIHIRELGSGGGKVSDLMAKCDWHDSTLSIVLPEDPERIAIRPFDSQYAPARCYVPEADVLRLLEENVKLRKLLQRTWDAFHDATEREFVAVKNELRELGIEVDS